MIKSVEKFLVDILSSSMEIRFIDGIKSGAFVDCYGGVFRIWYGSCLMVASLSSLVVLVFGGFADEGDESEDQDKVLRDYDRGAAIREISQGFEVDESTKEGRVGGCGQGLCGVVLTSGFEYGRILSDGVPL
ncbi:hypothetical protein OIU79_015300 [Salix purpurea]|uniref:Uncharacterized protein n=1 Tax=Salix purpurea TaxID=77065 RepID=A0A9Q0PBV4_SALPP|nr:hypothetical protein OIU79_015300 [Salix purpurea]